MSHREPLHQAEKGRFATETDEATTEFRPHFRTNSGKLGKSWLCHNQRLAGSWQDNLLLRPNSQLSETGRSMSLRHLRSGSLYSQGTDEETWFGPDGV